METKPLLYGLVGFFIGGLLVAIAANTFDKAELQSNSMSQMASSLKSKTGDDYDQTFITGMIAHHQDALDMAKLSESRAKHDEIKQLSKDIIVAQQKEIDQMKQWQRSWKYNVQPDHQMGH